MTAATQLGLLLVAAALTAAACATGPAGPAGTPAVTLRLTAVNLAFDQTKLTVPADQPFAIELDNREAVPHNVAIRGGPRPMSSETFTGPQMRTHQFSPLPAGSYGFICELHPEMAGTIDSVASAQTSSP